MKTRIILITGAFLVVLGVFLMEKHSTFVVREMNTFKLLPHDEHFTELYFLDGATPPKVLSKGDPIVFSYVIHNNEGERVVYPYELYVVEDGARVTLEKNWIALEDGEATTLTKSFTPKGAFKVMEIFVELPAQQEQLHFTTTEVR